MKATRCAGAALVVAAVTAATACIHPHGTGTGFENDRGSSRIITAATIEKSGAQSVWEALQRTVPFYTFEANGQIHHRGRTSLYLPDQPLIVLDGVGLTDFSVLTGMPASDVWLIEVVDDVNATTYYGTNAGQGAIRIFTKTAS